jgi:DNA (cytosine-5)-methyltransferase 1
MIKKLPHTHIDLFAGCGGLALGLHEAGWQGLFAVERDPMGFETLERNMLDGAAPYPGFDKWPSWLPKQNHTIESLLDTREFRAELEALRGSVCLVAGGPPCQGFSVGGIRNGADERNQLIVRMLEFVELVEPQIVLVENVEGIARRFVSKPGAIRESVADYVVRRLRAAGYDADYVTVDASRFGVPQVRRRVFIVGVHRSIDQGRGVAANFGDALEHVRIDMLAELGLPLERPITVGEAIADLDGVERVVCPDSPAFMAGTYTEPTSDFALLMRRAIAGGALPNSHRFSKHGERIRALYEAAHRTQPRGRLSKSFLRSWDTKKDKKVLLDPDLPASTITTHPDEFIHYSEPRNITVREMARLQSFPDDFHFHGRYTINGPRRRHDVARCSQVGNAVPPLLARAAGLALIVLLRTAMGETTDFELTARPPATDGEALELLDAA